MLSCRVQGKLLERALFQHVVESHNRDGLRRVLVNFRKTARNKPAQLVLESLGFRPVEGATGQAAGMELQQPEWPQWGVIRVQCACLVGPLASEDTVHHTQ